MLKCLSTILLLGSLTVFGGCSTTDIMSLSDIAAVGGAGGGGSSTLPFPVKIGGQSASVANNWSARIAAPVSPSASFSVPTGEQVIINVFPSDADGRNPGSQVRAVYILENGGSKGLQSVLQGTPPTSGTYLANIVRKSQGTARVVFTVR